MFPISSCLLDTDHKDKNDDPGEPINWQLHSSSIETSEGEGNNHDIGNQELAALELSPISPATGCIRLMTVCSFSDVTGADTNLSSSTKSDSPGVESGKDYSSISSFSTLTSASKLPTDDIDFINFYFENNRRQTQLKGNSVYEISIPTAARNRFLDCSPIPKLNFDETLTNLPSPEDGCSHVRTSPASAESALEEELYEAVRKNVGGCMDDSAACVDSLRRAPAFLSAPVNSPNGTREMGSIPSSSKLWYCPPTEVDGLPSERSLGQSVANILPESAAQKWKLDSRPPCVGQEHSPESELNFPDTWRAIRNAADEQHLSPSTTDIVDSDIDLTEIDPPSPVLKNSARKVGSWLQRLQEGNYLEDPAVETSLAVRASTLKVMECVRSSEKCKCGAYNDYMNARKKRVGEFHNSSITTSPSKSTVSGVSINSVLSPSKAFSAVARKQWTSSETAVAVLSTDGSQYCDEKAKRYYRKSRRSDGINRHRLYNIVDEKELQNIKGDGSLTRRTSRPREPATSNSSSAKHSHLAQNNDCKESNLSSSDDNTLCSAHEDAYMHKTMTKNPSSTVFFVGHTNPARTVLKKTQMSSKRVLAKKLKAISLYMRHKKTHSHLNFKTLAIV